MEFLPADDPHVAGTIAAIERELTIDGLVYRFDPGVTLGGGQALILQADVADADAIEVATERRLVRYATGGRGARSERLRIVDSRSGSHSGDCSDSA
jgi:hypothetical protein